MKNSLSLCGGGIRGVLQVLQLAELERQTGKPVRELFSWVAGTSVGALITALIQAGVPMTKALEFFTGPDARSVFSPCPPVSELDRAARGYVYYPVNLARALSSALGARAQWTMADCPTGVMITAVGTDGHQWFFVRSGDTAKVSLVDAAVGSAAAPTYFAPWGALIGGKPVTLFDGGTCGMGNPSHQLCVEMFVYGQERPEENRVICLGTGYYQPPTPAAAPRGLLATIGWSVDTMLDSADSEADRNARREFLHSSPDQYQILNWALPRAIDMADISAVPELVAIGTKAASQVDWKKVLGL